MKKMVKGLIKENRILLIDYEDGLSNEVIENVIERNGRVIILIKEHLTDFIYRNTELINKVRSIDYLLISESDANVLDKETNMTNENENKSNTQTKDAESKSQSNLNKKVFPHNEDIPDQRNNLHPEANPPLSKKDHSNTSKRLQVGLSKALLFLQNSAEPSVKDILYLGLEEGKEVFSIPEEIKSKYIGGNSFIRQGAKLTSDVKDILNDL